MVCDKGEEAIVSEGLAFASVSADIFKEIPGVVGIIADGIDLSLNIVSLVK